MKENKYDEQTFFEKHCRMDRSKQGDARYRTEHGRRTAPPDDAARIGGEKIKNIKKTRLSASSFLN